MNRDGAGFATLPPATLRRPPPLLGEHTNEVLAKAGAFASGTEP